MQFAHALKDWRRRRGYSQERLGLEANVSTRHIAFMETGRARPSRAMVVRLSEALEMPRTERNGLLEAAGFSALYVARPPDGAGMACIRAGLTWMLDRHDPYPAFSLDRHWHVLMHNRTAGLLLAQLNLEAGDNLLDAALSPGGLRRFILNWPEVARYLAQRLRTESRSLGGDARLTEVAAKLAEGAGSEEALAGPLPAVLQTRYRINGLELSMFSTISQFGSADDLALADVRVEYLFPADDATRAALFALGGPDQLGA